MKYFWLIILWIGFGISHSYLISGGFTGWVKDVLGRNYSFYRLAYNIISFASFIPLLYYTKLVDSQLVIDVNLIVQVILLSLSTFILIWSFFTFDPLEFIGLRQVIRFYTGQDAADDRQVLVSTGLYGIVRHPMYSGTLLFIWGLDSTLAEVIMKIILSIYLFVGAILEERKLIQEFGQSYVEYQKKVPMLIPFPFR